MNAVSKKILFIDDDEAILRAFQRDLDDDFNISIAKGCAEGMRIVKTEGPFAVIVCDNKMPVMSGVEFLSKVREHFPDTVRVMLTGHGDLETAMKAVNEDEIFRFLTKPCDSETMEKVLCSALEQYRLVTVEHDLLERTFKGCINVLIDILSLTNPLAFSRTNRIRYIVNHLADGLEIPNRWCLDTAAMLSQIGCVTIPAEILDKVFMTSACSEEERALIKAYPQIGHDLIERIPRLQKAAEMIGLQQNTMDAETIADGFRRGVEVTMGATLLRIALEFDTAVVQGCPRMEILQKIAARHMYPDRVLAQLRTLPMPSLERQKKPVRIQDLCHGMVLASDVTSEKGVLLARSGQEMTNTLKIMLANYAQQDMISDSVCVKMQVYKDPEGDGPQKKHDLIG